MFALCFYAGSMDAHEFLVWGSNSTYGSWRIEDWWERSLGKFPKAQRRNIVVLIIYTTCNIWGEKNRRTFLRRNEDGDAGLFDDKKKRRLVSGSKRLVEHLCSNLFLCMSI